MELLLRPRACGGGAGGTAGAAANLISPLVEEREPDPEMNSPSQPVCISCCLANKSPGNLTPTHPNSSLYKQPQFSTLLYLFLLPEYSYVSLTHENILCKLQNSLEVLVVAINNPNPSL